MCGNTVCSDMVLTSFASNRFIFNSTIVVIERYIQQPDCVI